MIQGKAQCLPRALLKRKDVVSSWVFEVPSECSFFFFFQNTYGDFHFFKTVSLHSDCSEQELSNNCFTSEPTSFLIKVSFLCPQTLQDLIVQSILATEPALGRFWDFEIPTLNLFHRGCLWRIQYKPFPLEIEVITSIILPATSRVQG